MTAHGCLTNSPTNPDPQTGTRRLDLWCEIAEAAANGDMRAATATARAISPTTSTGAPRSASTPSSTEDGSFGVDEMATYGRAILEDGIWRPDDCADISYEGGSALAFDTLEDAQREADRLGQIDQSYALYLRGKVDMSQFDDTRDSITTIAEQSAATAAGPRCRTHREQLRASVNGSKSRSGAGSNLSATSGVLDAQRAERYAAAIHMRFDNLLAPPPDDFDLSTTSVHETI